MAPSPAPAWLWRSSRAACSSSWRSRTAPAAAPSGEPPAVVACRRP
jgi:hypothetical protein